MKPLLILVAATLCFAATEARISRATIVAVEKSINEKFSEQSGDPYELEGNARGTYLEGYGALFTTELDLVNTGPLTLSPFKPTISIQEIAAKIGRAHV